MPDFVMSDRATVNDILVLADCGYTFYINDGMIVDFDAPNIEDDLDG